MNLLIAFGRDTFSNPFVRTLADGLSRQGIHVTCSMDEFWNNWNRYDVIHLQWPAPLVEGLESIEVFRSHLLKIKAAGIPLVITCHNFRPHYSEDMMEAESYDVAYQCADSIIHLGTYSLQEFQKKYPEKKHVVIPHHIYDELYKSIPSREDAIKYLKLNPRKKYILCFGKFRHQEERGVANTVAKALGRRGVEVLAPGFFRFVHNRNLKKFLKGYSQYFLHKIRYRRIHFSTGYVPDSVLPYYFAASDVVLIQRKQILNSGNLPLAYMMGKVVVGPDVGNVGAILRETGNPTFDVSDLSTIVDAAHEALALDSSGKGGENRRYALDNYATDVVAQLHRKLYDDLRNPAPSDGGNP